DEDNRRADERKTVLAITRAADNAHVERRFIVVLVVSGLLTLLASSAAVNAGASSPWPGCSSFATQPQAQAWWRAHGRPAAADRDHDGVVCETCRKAQAAEAAASTPAARVSTASSRSACRRP